jgi:hypothetical protein
MAPPQYFWSRTAHVPARNEMKGRWKHPISAMGWYRTAKKDFAALPGD